MLRKYDREYAIELYNKGLSYKEIAKEVGAALSTIYGLIDGMDLPRRKGKPIDEKKVEELITKGCTYAEIRRKTGATLAQIEELTKQVNSEIELLIAFSRRELPEAFPVIVHGKQYMDITDIVSNMYEIENARCKR
jgi:transposase